MKILFITATRIGDAVLSTGLLDYMRVRWPEAKVTVACGPLPASLFEGFPNAARIIPVKKRKFHGHWLDLWKDVAGTRWDMVVDLRNSAVSRLIWAKKRFIYGPSIDKNLHKVEQAARTMGLEDAPSPRLFFTREQEVFADSLMGAAGRADVMTLGIGPSANWIGKTWDAAHFIRVMEFLTAKDGPMPHARVAVFAAKGEEAQAVPVLEAVPPERRIDCIGKGNPGEAAAALARCDFYIGNDSGLLHMAASSGVPCFGLYGPSWPHLYAPWGEHTGYACTPQTFDELVDFEGYDPKTLDRSLMGGLQPETVIDIIKSFEPLYERVSLHLTQKEQARQQG
ncbi:MAG: glycosyltransferase family 9 protein [Micavibrio sp.]